MIDIVLEAIQLAVLIVATLILWFRGRQRLRVSPVSWRLIFSGFLLLTFGSALDLSDNFENLNRFWFIGHTGPQTVLEEIVGFLGGVTLLALGLIIRIPEVEAMAREVARRKESEEELKRYRDELEVRVKERTALLEESEARYSQIFETTAAGVGRTSTIDGRVLLSNQKLAEMFGFPSVEEFKANYSFVDHYAHSGDRERVFAFVQEHPGEPLEIDFTRPDGSIITVLTHSRRNLEEEVMDFVLIDITERKQVQNALKESEERFRSFFENTPISMALKDRDGYFRLVNAAFKERHGLSDSEVIGKTAYDLYDESYAETFSSMDRETIEGKVAIERELEVPIKDGSMSLARVNRFPLRDARGEVTGVGAISMDITEWRKTEEQLRQLQKMEAIGQLTGGIAHDFNNLLQVMQGNLELLANNPKVDKQRVEPILRAAARGSELTGRLLAFSRLQPLRPRPIKPDTLVKGLSDMLIRTLGETIEVKVHSEPGLWPALADPGQVENAILNLALNARDAMPSGGKLTIECANASLDDTETTDIQAGDYVLFSVSDEGTGMPDEVREHAFEPFFTTKEFGHGSGLGLSMVYGFAKQSGGHAEIVSAPEQGTMVRLYLPRAIDSPLTDTSPKAADLPRGKGERILLVEDDREVRELATEILEGLGYVITGVSRAAEARQVLQEDVEIDLMLTDVVLPGGVSGPEFAEEVCGRYPGLKVIFMSGYAAEAAQRVDCFHPDQIMLNKPFARNELAQAIRTVLDQPYTVYARSS